MENMNDYERREVRLSSCCRKRSSLRADEESSNHKSKKPSTADSNPNKKKSGESTEIWTTSKESESESRDKSAELESCDDSESSETSLNYDYGLAQPNHHRSLHYLRATKMKYPDPYQKWLPVYSTHQHQPLNLNPSYNLNNKAKPLFHSAWAGAFSVKPVKKRNIVAETFDGLRGCVSSKACKEARLVAEQLPPLIRWEKLPKLCVWHRKFEEWGPTDDDIALFFLPSLAKHETAYDSLVFDLIRGDLAMRTVVMGSELLLFTSVDLPPLATRFQGKLYLWGVFRGNQLPRL